MWMDFQVALLTVRGTVMLVITNKNNNNSSVYLVSVSPQIPNEPNIDNLVSQHDKLQKKFKRDTIPSHSPVQEVTNKEAVIAAVNKVRRDILDLSKYYLQFLLPFIS